MNNQEFESRMNFLMDQHTQFEQRHSVWKIEIEDILARLARVTKEGFNDHSAKMNALIDAQIRTEEEHRKTEEQVRLTAEAQRKTDKQIGLTAEAQRKTDEQIRSTAEAQRTTDEQIRSTAEAQRKTDEQIRSTAEAQRKTDEQIRLTAEAQRKTEQTLERYLRSKFNGGNNN